MKLNTAAQIIKIFIILSLTAHYTYAKEIKPVFILKSKGLVKDFVLDGAKLYVANDEGSVEVFDLYKHELIDEIFIEPFMDKKQKWRNCKIISVDRQNGKTLIVSTTTKGFRNVWIHDGKELHNIIDTKKELTVKEARFINNENILFGTLGHEMILYNNTDRYNAYSSHIEESAFSDVALSEDKTKMVSASESGRVILADVKTGKIIKEFSSLNVDNIYKVDYKKGTIITAGQDRRVGVYPKEGKPYYIKSDFLVYSAALSPSGQIGIYSSGENNHLQLFDVKSGKKTDTLIGHYAVPTTIRFINERELFSAGDENKIFYWRID